MVSTNVVQEKNGTSCLFRTKAQLATGFMEKKEGDSLGSLIDYSVCGRLHGEDRS
jgi:hypothetical protein